MGGKQFSDDPIEVQKLLSRLPGKSSLNKIKPYHLVGAVLGLLSAGHVWADEASNWWQNVEKSDRATLANAAGIGFITYWGVRNWDYGDRSPHAQKEHWFDSETKYGGADKIGHAYTTYALSHGLNFLYQKWGYPRDEAATRSAWSSFGLMSFMELGDSFSQYGFSYEDLIMNAVGSYAGYVSATQPKIRDLVDFRVEYRTDLSRLDFFTDYEKMKYLIAIKADGVDVLNNTLARFFELQLGYFTRGYPTSANTVKERNAYVAIGVNLSHLISQAGYKKTATIFNYLQLPEIYVDAQKPLN